MNDALPDVIRASSRTRSYPALLPFYDAITSIAVEIAGLLRRAGLANILGSANTQNVSGDDVKKFDRISEEICIDRLRRSGVVSAYGSEESEEILRFAEAGGGNLAVYFDPLDGSSNIDVDVPVGTIFSVFPSKDVSAVGLAPGNRQIAAGYVIYGPATVLVTSVGDGVDIFTLDPAEGVFKRTLGQVRMPEKSQYYSTNEGNSAKWDAGVRGWIEAIKSSSSPTGKAYATRYVGSLVADFHRNLLKGGVFAYPADKKNEKGKLRLVYEANPMSYLMAQAGGAGTDGGQNILDLIPEKLHQRTPLFLGNLKDIEFIRSQVSPKS